MDVILDIIASSAVAASIAELEELGKVLVEGATRIGAVTTTMTTILDVTL